jgi:hypothetical protein
MKPDRRDLAYRDVLAIARQVHTWKELQLEILPARGPRGSRVNRIRARLTQRCLRAWSEIGREGT